MYSHAVPNRNSPPAVVLRAGFLVDGKVKNRTLANLTHWPVERVEALRRALRGEFDGVAGEAQCGAIFGVQFALKQLADQLGISRALGRTEDARRALFLVLARIAHGGSRLSAVRWARQHATEDLLGLAPFDEDDLYASLDWLASRQPAIEQRLYEHYRQRSGQTPVLLLYDVTSSYLEGECNELGAFGYNRDGKRGKRQIVIGLLTDAAGEPLAVRVFEGNRSDPTTVAEQIKIVKEQFQVEELVFVGDRGMVKSKGKQALEQAKLRYITALTDPQIRGLLKRGILQLELFSEQLCEVEDHGVRYVLRKNETEATRERHRLEDKLAKLEEKIASRNEETKKKQRCQPEAGKRKLEAWAAQHKLQGLLTVKLEGRMLILERQKEAMATSLELAGCYVVTTDVLPQSMSTQEVHDSYVSLQKLERDFRAMKTGLLEVRPFFVRKESRTRCHVFCCMLALKLSREIERRLREQFGTTDSNPHPITLRDPLTSLGSLCLLHYKVAEKTTVPKLPQPSANQRKMLTGLRSTPPPTR